MPASSVRTIKRGAFSIGFCQNNSTYFIQRAHDYHGESHANEEKCFFDVVYISHVATKPQTVRSALVKLRD